MISKQAPLGTALEAPLDATRSSEWNWQMIYDLDGGQGETKGYPCSVEVI